MLNPIISAGAKGLIVKDIQEKLNSFEIVQPKLKPDGDWGKKTTTAIKQWGGKGDLGIEELKTLNIPYDLFYRMLSLTSQFENTWWTGSHGQYDSGIITHGIMGFTWSGGVLPEYLKLMFSKREKEFWDELLGENVYQKYLNLLSQPLEKSCDYLRSIIPHEVKLSEPWRTELKTISSQEFARECQIEMTKREYLLPASIHFNHYQMKTVRALMILFDTQIQLGSSKLNKFFVVNNVHVDSDEKTKINAVYNYGKFYAASEWKKCVRERKGIIKNGSGIYAGDFYSLDSLGLLPDSELQGWKEEGLFE